MDTRRVGLLWLLRPKRMMAQRMSRRLRLRQLHWIFERFAGSSCLGLVWLAWQREDSGCENGGRLAGLLRLPMMRSLAPISPQSLQRFPGSSLMSP